MLENLQKTYGRWPASPGQHEPGGKAGRAGVLLGPSSLAKPRPCGSWAACSSPLAGTSWWTGTQAWDLPREGHGVQLFNLFPWRTAEANVAFGLEAQGMRKRERLAIAREKLNLVGLADKAQSYPRSCRAVKTGESGSPARSPSSRRSCSWTSRSAPWTRSPASICRVCCRSLRRPEPDHPVRHPLDRRGGPPVRPGRGDDHPRPGDRRLRSPAAGARPATAGAPPRATASCGPASGTCLGRAAAAGQVGVRRW